ncbi:hypothetical protein, partial [Enterobacter intestinihominis]
PPPRVFFKAVYGLTFIYIVVVVFFFFIRDRAIKPQKLTDSGLIDMVCIWGGAGKLVFFNGGVFLIIIGCGRDPARDPVSHLRLNHHRSHHNGPTKETYR